MLLNTNYSIYRILDNLLIENYDINFKMYIHQKYILTVISLFINYFFQTNMRSIELIFFYFLRSFCHFWPSLGLVYINHTYSPNLVTRIEFLIQMNFIIIMILLTFYTFQLKIFSIKYRRICFINKN